MVINQWVPAAHQGDAIGDSARTVRSMLRAAGHQSDLFALTIDDELRGDVRAFSEPAAREGEVTIFHFALPSPMTEAFATLRGGRVLQYHNITPAEFFAPYDAGLFRLAALGRSQYFNDAIADRAVATAVVQHKSFFFIEKDTGGRVIDYMPAVTGHLKIVPEGEALEALAADYANMLADAVMVGEALPFDQLMQACGDVETQVNEAAAT